MDEATFAAKTGLAAEALSHARAVFNAIVRSPGSDADRLALLLALSEGPGADIGPTYGAAMLALGEVSDLTALMAVRGVGEKRLAAVARALAQAPLSAVPSGGGAPGEDPRLAELEAQVAALIAERDAALAKVDALAVERDALLLRSTEAEVALRAAESELEQLQDPLPAPPEVVVSREGTLALERVASSAGEQLHATQARLKRAESPMRLGAVSMALKGGLAMEGEALAMRFPREGLDPAQVSELSLTFTPVAEAPATPTGDRVPDLVGYTEAHALRKAGEAGYRVTVRRIHQLAEREARLGRVLAQRPVAGEEVPADGRLVLDVGA